MLSSTGTSARHGVTRRPRDIAMTKIATVAIAERIAAIHSGGRLAMITLFTGHVRPQTRTTTINRMMPSRRAARSSRPFTRPSMPVIRSRFRMS